MHKPEGSNELWQVGITYVDIPGYGTYYCINVVDYYSRYVLATKLSDTHRIADVIEALELAL